MTDRFTLPFDILYEKSPKFAELIIKHRLTKAITRDRSIIIPVPAEIKRISAIKTKEKKIDSIMQYILRQTKLKLKDVKDDVKTLHREFFYTVKKDGKTGFLFNKIKVALVKETENGLIFKASKALVPTKIVKGGGCKSKACSKNFNNPVYRLIM